MITIGIYDSGIGGISVLNVLREYVRSELPQEHVRYVYLCDNLHYPYGTKKTEDLVSFVCETVRKMLAKYSIDILIIACNTASTVVLPYLRDMFPVPIVGVVPAIKPACAKSKTKHVCLVATQATITRPSLDELIQLYGNGCQILRIGSSLLVDIAERKFRSYPVDESLIEQEIKPVFLDPLIDTVILGCTHFVHLKENFIRVLSHHPYKDISVIDSSDGVSLHCIDLIKKIVIPKHSNQSTKDDLDSKGMSESDFYIYNKDHKDNIFVFTKKDDMSMELITSHLNNKCSVSFLE